MSNEVLVLGSCGIGFAMGALAWSSFLSSLQSEGSGFHVGGLAWVSVTLSIFLCFTSIITSLSYILATLGHLQGVLGLKFSYKFLSTSVSRNSLEGVPWVSLSLFKKDDGGLLWSLQGMNNFFNGVFVLPKHVDTFQCHNLHIYCHVVLWYYKF